MQPAKISEVEKLLEGRIEGRIANKSVAPLDWRAKSLEIGNWKGLVEECISSSVDPFGMFSAAPRPRVSADSTESDEADLKELLTLLMRTIESDDEKESIGTDKRRYRKVQHPSDKRVANDALPAPTESVTGWIARLAAQFDVTRGPRAAFFQGLRAYSSRFADKRFEDLSKGDRNVLNLFVNRIQEAA